MCQSMGKQIARNLSSESFGQQCAILVGERPVENSSVRWLVGWLESCAGRLVVGSEMGTKEREREGVNKGWLVFFFRCPKAWLCLFADFLS